MAPAVRALRGATTVAADTKPAITERTVELLTELLARNDATVDDLISVLFTATPDLTSMFPASRAAVAGFGAVPLLCATEIDVVGATPRCIRVLAHLTSERGADALHHIYLHDAIGLRDDLPD
jgi:chorismate mutase